MAKESLKRRTISNVPRRIDLGSREKAADANHALKTEIPKDMVSIFLDDIVLAPQIRKAGRITKDLKTKMGTSIKDKGQLQNIVVERTEDGKFLLHTGEHRYWGMKEAGESTIVAKVLNESLTKRGRIDFQLTENTKREEVNMLDLASSIKELAMIDKKTPMEVLQTMDFSSATNRSVAALISLTDPSFQGLLKYEKIFSKTTLHIYLPKLLAKHKTLTVEELIKKSVDTGEDYLAKFHYDSTITSTDSLNTMKPRTRQNRAGSKSKTQPYTLRQTNAGYVFNVNLDRISKLAQDNRNAVIDGLVSELQKLADKALAMKEGDK